MTIVSARAVGMTHHYDELKIPGALTGVIAPSVHRGTIGSPLHLEAAYAIP
ncbi:MAG: hypothetical protein QM784_00825 [Polyangiaceae bacterium]